MYRFTHEPHKKTSTKLKSKNKNIDMKIITYALPWSEDVPLL